VENISFRASIRLSDGSFGSGGALVKPLVIFEKELVDEIGREGDSVDIFKSATRVSILNEVGWRERRLVGLILPACSASSALFSAERT
jgi:hypothetical protein